MHLFTMQILPPAAGKSLQKAFNPLSYSIQDVETPLALEMERQSSPALTVYTTPEQGAVGTVVVGVLLIRLTQHKFW